MTSVESPLPRYIHFPVSFAFATPFFYSWKGTREAPLILRWNQKGTGCRTKRVSNVVKAILGPYGGFYMMLIARPDKWTCHLQAILPNLYVQNWWMATFSLPTKFI